jgi:polysaccharide biosynthesis/export protein
MKPTILGIRNLYVYLMLIVTVLLSSSCIDTQKATTFYGLGDGNIRTNTAIPEPVLRKNDILSITVSSLNPQATEIFNMPNPAGFSGNGATGYLIGPDGSFQFPVLGIIKAEGLTKEQLKQSITQKVLDGKLLTDPTVVIRLLNFRVTVLGEVSHPLVVNVPNEKISLLEAIGMAGDMTIYANKSNVLVLREENGQRVSKRINLNSTELLTSPYYYLKSEDVVYVEPNKARVASTSRSTQWMPVVFGALSLAAIVLTRK